jgi:peroxiredoxin
MAKSGIDSPRVDRRAFLALAGLSLLLMALPYAAGAAEGAPRIGSLLPAAAFQALDGSTVRIPDGIRGKVAILHFWRAGCSSCKLEMPAMDGLYAAYRRRGLEILAVNVGQKPDIVRAFAKELRVSYPLLTDPEGRSAALYGAADVPRTYIVDRAGVVRYRILGGAAPETVRKLVLSLL